MLLLLFLRYPRESREKDFKELDKLLYGYSRRSQFYHNFYYYNSSKESIVFEIYNQYLATIIFEIELQRKFRWKKKC